MKKYLGIDYGSDRIGIAISNDRGSIAFPRETVPNDATAIDRITGLVRREEVQEVVYGDTRADNGGSNQVTTEAEAFAHALGTHLKIPIHLVREAWSTFEAARYAPKGEEHNDAAAAAIILQRYLDKQQ